MIYFILAQIQQVWKTWKLVKFFGKNSKINWGQLADYF